MDDRLLEPLDAYKNHYEREFSENINSLFDDLVQKSGIDVAANRSTTKAMREQQRLSDNVKRRLDRFSAIRILLIVLAVAGIAAAIFGIYFICTDLVMAGAISLSVGATIAIAAIVVICAVLNRKIKGLEEEKQRHDLKVAELRKTAWAQMAPLNDLFDSNMTKQLIEKTVPLLQIDDNFNMRRFDYLNGKYGFGEPTHVNSSTLGILTGEILGNPFVVDRELVTYMGSKTYYGSIIIHWTTTYVDSDGNTHVQSHTQTLTASVTKPQPQYSKQTRLIYGNEAAPDLHFTHTPTHAEDLSEAQLERKVKRGARKIRRKQRKELKKGGATFTEMGNEEFDVIFGATDRDNEVQFRLLFTPLAQKNMLALMKDDEGYGDDFKMIKDGPINIVSSEHSAQWDMDTDYRKFYSYDFDLCKQNFAAFNKQYFRSLYFDLAPLLSIPLYQQQKPHEYIYKDTYARNLTGYEAEYAVNRLGEAAFRHPASITPAILKTSIIAKDGTSDHVEVTAHSYKGEDRVDLVPMLGGDGHMHSVPVHWTEYIPIQNSSTVKLKELKLTDKQFEKRLASTPLSDALGAYGQRSYGHGILCCMVEATDKSFDTELEKAIK